MDQEAKKETIVTAKIHEISAFGNMTIRFSHEMRAEFLDIEDIDSDVLDISLKPALDREESTTFNTSQIDFKWKAYGYEGKDLLIKLDFTYPTLISPLYVQDSLHVEIKDPDQNLPIFFQPIELNLKLDPRSWKMVSKVRK